MPITVEPKWNGESVTAGANPSATLEWLVIGTDDLGAAQAALAAGADQFVYVGNLTIPLEQASITSRIAEQIFIGETQYGYQQIQLEETDETLSFSTQGGKSRITQSRGTTIYQGSRETPDFKGAIGVTPSGVEGVDITSPTLTFQKTKRFAAGFVTNAYVRLLSGLTGTTNNAPFLGFQIGELLFEGATGSQKHPDQPWDITFQFNASQNATGLTAGTITGIAKKGWEYLWVLYQEQDDTTAKYRVRRPIGAYVETVYPSGDFSGLGLSGT